MSKLVVGLLLMVVCVLGFLLGIRRLPQGSQNRCLVLTPSGAGNHSGSDWNNAIPAFPSHLNPGGAYYLAGGDYSSTAGYVFKNPDPSAMITIRKATQSDHCVAIGWNKESMGDPVARWDFQDPPTPVLEFDTGGFTFDGVTGDGTATTGTYGFYFRLMDPTRPGFSRDLIVLGYPGIRRDILSNITLSHLEIDGGNPYELQGNSQGFPIFTSSPNSYFNLAFTFVYIHDTILGPTSIYNVDGVTFAHDYFARNRSTTSWHSDGLVFKSNPQDGVSANNLTVYDSVFEDIEGTASIVCLWGRCTNWNIFNVVFFDNGTPIDIRSIRRSKNTVTCVLASAPPASWKVGAWVKVSRVEAGNGDTVAFDNSFRLTSVNGDAVQWNQPGPDDSGKLTPERSMVSVAGQSGVSYVIGENGGGIVGLTVAHITVAGMPGNTSGVECANAPSNCIVRNSLWYDSANVRLPETGVSGYGSHDYNTILNSSYAYMTNNLNSPHEHQYASSMPDPFINRTAKDFHLAPDLRRKEKYLEGCAVLPPPFDLDFDGLPRSTTNCQRGAYQFGLRSGSGAPATRVGAR
jgi:hypothetical protein